MRAKLALSRTCNFLSNLVDVSDIFFFCSGEGKGESEAPAGGGAATFY